MTKSSAFRLWVQELWYENCDECREWHDQAQTLETYWNKYKWWLKREYRHQTRR